MLVPWVFTIKNGFVISFWKIHRHQLKPNGIQRCFVISHRIGQLYRIYLSDCCLLYLENWNKQLQFILLLLWENLRRNILCDIFCRSHFRCIIIMSIASILEKLREKDLAYQIQYFAVFLHSTSRYDIPYITWNKCLHPLFQSN